MFIQAPLTSFSSLTEKKRMTGLTGLTGLTSAFQIIPYLPGKRFWAEKSRGRMARSLVNLTDLA